MGKPIPSSDQSIGDFVLPGDRDVHVLEQYANNPLIRPRADTRAGRCRSLGCRSGSGSGEVAAARRSR